METTGRNRRHCQRFDVHLSLRYRKSEKGVEHPWGTGITRNMSKDGVAFNTRRPPPVGSHVELRIDWPVRQESVRPIDVEATGFVVRSDGDETAVRLISPKFRVHQAGALDFMPSRFRPEGSPP